MRQHKFKFWLGHTQKMTYSYNLSEVGKVIPEFTDDIIPLDFTGIHDSQGEEIYEGDRVTKGSDIVKTVNWSQQMCQFHLKWTDNQGRKRYEPLCADYSDGVYYSNSHITIVGNASERS